MAAVKFISHVQQGDNNWFIELTDTFDDTKVICKDMDEYKKALEDMGSEYGNDIEVQWIRSKNLTPASIEDLLEKMAKMQEEYEKEINEMYNNENEQNGFNPNE